MIFPGLACVDRSEANTAEKDCTVVCTKNLQDKGLAMAVRESDWGGSKEVDETEAWRCWDGDPVNSNLVLIGNNAIFLDWSIFLRQLNIILIVFRGRV